MSTDPSAFSTPPRTAVVTGASSGLGVAIAKGLGANTILVPINFFKHFCILSSLINVYIKICINKKC